jgi:hypothetical protein
MPRVHPSDGSHAISTVKTADFIGYPMPGLTERALGIKSVSYPVVI